MKCFVPLALLIILGLNLFSMVWADNVWIRERPGNDLDLSDRIENNWSDGNVSVGVGVDIYKYEKDDGSWGPDTVRTRVSMAANSRRGILYREDKFDYWPAYRWIEQGDLYGVTTLPLGDNDGCWVSFDFPFRFYGGRQSAEYNSAWVSSNGFLCFDLSQSNSTGPSGFPSPLLPNAVIAAFWTDLVVDSQASVYTGYYSGGLYSLCFVITWNNVRYKYSDSRYTFQIQLYSAPPWNEFYRQSDIWISYKTMGDYVSYFRGIEDHEGLRGQRSWLLGWDETAWRFTQDPYSYILQLHKLTLEFADNCSEALYDIRDAPGDLKGYNLQPNTQWSPDPNKAYLKALGGTYTLMMTWGGIIADVPAWPITLPVSCILVTSSWFDYLAYAQYNDTQPLQVVDSQIDPNTDTALVSAITVDGAVDASLSAQLYWGLTDVENERWHSLTITATAEYYQRELQTGNIISAPSISTTVYVKIGPDDNNGWSSADTVYGGCTYSNLCIGCYDEVDTYRLYMSTGSLIDVYTNMTAGGLWYNVSIYDPAHGLKNFSDINQAFQRVKFIADSAGFWYVQVCAKPPNQDIGVYTLKIESPPGGGCPFSYNWNGTNYVIDNNLLPASERSLGSDVQDHYKMEQPMIPKYTNRFFSVYSLEIAENEHEHSYFDQVKLQTVDYDPNINVAVSPTGQILTYAAPIPPKIALDTLGTDQSALMSVMDNEYFEAYAGDSLLVSFGELNLTQGAKLVLGADAWKVSIHVQIQAQNSDWNDVASVIPRVNWATDIIDLSPFLPNTTTEVRIRLYFTAHHKIDFLGIDTSPQADITVHDAILIFANHSTQGPVTFRLFETDTLYGELTPGQQVQLFFIATNQPAQKKRSFILYSAGHYEKVN